MYFPVLFKPKLSEVKLKSPYLKEATSTHTSTLEFHLVVILMLEMFNIIFKVDLYS